MKNQKSLITDINISKKNPNLVEIYIDNQLYGVIDYAAIETLDLHIDRAVPQDILEKINYNSNLSKAKNEALNFLSYRPRSEWEIKNKLYGRKYDSNIITDTIDWLKNRKYINDWEFSLQWIKYIINKKPAGKIKLKNELFKKGIDEDTIHKVIDYFFEHYENEILLAKELIKRKEYSLRSKNMELEPARISRLLKSQGFSSSTIRAIHSRYTDSE